MGFRGALGCLQPLNSLSNMAGLQRRDEEWYFVNTLVSTQASHLDGWHWSSREEKHWVERSLTRKQWRGLGKDNLPPQLHDVWRQAWEVTGGELPQNLEKKVGSWDMDLLVWENSGRYLECKVIVQGQNGRARHEEGWGEEAKKRGCVHQGPWKMELSGSKWPSLKVLENSETIPVRTGLISERRNDGGHCSPERTFSPKSAAVWGMRERGKPQWNLPWLSLPFNLLGKSVKQTNKQNSTVPPDESRKKSTKREECLCHWRVGYWTSRDRWTHWSWRNN